jgi:hypothetical protein
MKRGLPWKGQFVGALRVKRVFFLLIIGTFLIETKGISTIS